MALAPLSGSRARRVQVSKRHAKAVTDRTAEQCENPGPKTFMRRSSSPWPDGLLASKRFCEESWVFDGSLDCDFLEKVARQFNFRFARVFEYTPKVGSVAVHKGHNHPDGRLALEKTNDDVRLLSKNYRLRELVQSWKVGPGRKKDWRTAPCLRFANKDVMKLLRHFQQEEAVFKSRPFHLQDSEFIPLVRQALISPNVPKVMSEHTMAGHRSRKYPKPSTVKNFARQLGIPTSNVRWPRNCSKPFSPKAGRLVDGDGVDDEEDDDDSFEPGPSDEYFEGNLFSDTGSDV